MEIQKITSNKSKRHYTIYCVGFVLRTTQLSKSEFEELDFNTNEDWKSYIRNNEVIRIK